MFKPFIEGAAYGALTLVVGLMIAAALGFTAPSRVQAADLVGCATITQQADQLICVKTDGMSTVIAKVKE